MDRFYEVTTVPAEDMQVYNRLYYIPQQEAGAYSRWAEKAAAGFTATFEDGASARMYMQYPEGEVYPQVCVELTGKDGHLIKTVKAHVSLVNTTYFIGTRNKEYYYTVQAAGSIVNFPRN